MCGILELANLTLGAPTTLPLPSEIFDLVIDQLEEDRTTLKPHVRGVKLSIDKELAPTALMVTCIQELVNEDSNLLSLSIETVLGGGMSSVDDHLQALLSARIFKNLRHLKLKYLRFKNLNDGIGLYSSLPALESLVLHGVDSYNKGDQHEYTMSPPSNLRHLFIWAIGVPHGLCWLTIHPRHPLTTLHLYNITLAGRPILLDYLRQSSQLQCLSFDFGEWATHENLISNFAAQIDLTSQRDLRCLRINYARAVPILSELLPQVPSHLEEIAISLAGFYVSFAWADLHKILMSPAARCLKRLYVDKTHIHDVLEALPELPRVVSFCRCIWAGRATTELNLPAIQYRPCKVCFPAILPLRLERDHAITQSLVAFHHCCGQALPYSIT
ncbi:hypothetical protein BD779DRAFT_1475250 [Infundibulicybe gibba]|nr:hypothetical protein BD779DRAFT_1475250 [Infundibulicybe gibba]